MLTLRAFRRFCRDRKGLAAVEFAFILPVMLVLFFGIVEYSTALAARTDVTNIAAIAADLVAQDNAMSGADMTNVYKASTATLFPYNDSPNSSDKSSLTLNIYSIVDNGSSTGKVAWGCTCTAGTCSAITSTTAPTTTPGGGDMIASTYMDPVTKKMPAYGGPGSVILATVSYTYYSPVTKQMISAPITMGDSFYSKPRRVQQITKPTSCSG